MPTSLTSFDNAAQRSWSRLSRIARHVVLAAMTACLFAIASPARADVAECERAYQLGRKDEAIKLCRRAAWQENDFFAQVKLGDIYSAKREDDKGYYDAVEAYVWYFIAAHNSGIFDHFHLDAAADFVVSKLANAENEAEAIYRNLLQDERIDARNRIMYIAAAKSTFKRPHPAKSHRLPAASLAPMRRAGKHRPWKPGRAGPDDPRIPRPHPRPDRRAQHAPAPRPQRQRRVSSGSAHALQAASHRPLTRRCTSRMQRALWLRPARCPIPMRKDARNHPGVLDARHDLQPRPATHARFDLDAEHPLQTLRPAHRHMAWQPRPLRALLRAALLHAVAALAATGRRDQRTQAAPAATGSRTGTTARVSRAARA